MNTTETQSGSSLDSLVGRGPESEWVSSECPRCGSIYLDAALAHAQAMHDRNEPCDGTLCLIRAEANTELTAARKPLLDPCAF